MCEENIIHKDRVEIVKQNMKNEQIIIDVADFFKVFSDSTRVKILYALLESELCVCDIAAIISSSQSAVSHQLRILKQSKLVKYKKVGKVVYYSLDDDHIKDILEKGFDHIEEI